MAQKITLNELRSIVKQIIKETKEEEINQYNEDGKKQGYWEEYVNGALEKGNYENGKKNGTWEEYAFGVLIYKQDWENGKKHGDFVSYDNDGHLWAKGTFRNGKLGKVINYQKEKI